MALKSEITLLQPPNGGINFDDKSGEDLEDGEIFDDEIESEEKNDVKENDVKEQNAAPIPEAPKPAVKTDSNLTSEVNSASPAKKNKLSNRWNDDFSKKEKMPSGNEGREKKKKRKRPRDSEEDEIMNGPLKFKEKKAKTKFEKELEKLEQSLLEYDEYETLCMRGASPKDEWFDGEDEGFSDDEVEENSRRRGGFRSGPMRLDRVARRDRPAAIRGKRRGGGRGGGGGGDGMRKKMRSDDGVCKFFMQGKCQRGIDCPYSHDAMPPRKLEVCKFYLKDCCAKKDKCLYMHSEFPCKYYHTGLKCYSDKNCKFSHGDLTERLRGVLHKTFGPPSRPSKEISSKKPGSGKQRQHLETAPKEILGDFPRIRDGGGRSSKRDKKIPSLLELNVSMPNDMRSHSDSDGNHTPMPSPPPATPRDGRDSYRDSRSSEREPSPEHPCPPPPPERRREQKTDKPKSHSHKESKRSERSEESRERRERAERAARSSKDDAEDEETRNHNSGRRRSHSPVVEGGVGERIYIMPEDDTNEMFPAHLPKKQRELFERINRQQRPAESSQASGDDEGDEKKEEKQEDDWYSSDDEPEPPLSTILKNLVKQGKSSSNSQASHQQFQQPSVSASNLMNAIIPDFDIKEVSELLSKVKQHFQTTAEKTKLRDPRLSRADVGPSGDSDNSNGSGGNVGSSGGSASVGSHANRGPQTTLPLTPPSLPESTAASNVTRDRDHHQSVSLSEIDLRLKGSPLSGGAGDMDLRSLPFKPAPVHSAANEIDASINSHTPIPYKLIPLVALKADYSTMQSMPKGGTADPRWRKAIRFSEDPLSTTSSRDPRHRLVDDSRVKAPPPSAPTADPRQRNAPAPALNVALHHGPPPTPRYEDNHSPPALRNQFPMMNNQMGDFGMMCPPTPRLEDDQPTSTYIPPVRPTDPRQRHSALAQNINQGQPNALAFNQLRQQQQSLLTQALAMFDSDSRQRGMGFPSGMGNNADMGMGLNNANRTQYNFK